MSNAVLLPKAGNSVESCLLVAWKKAVGDPVALGDALCEIETDKATMEVESTATGILLAQLFAVGADVPVMTPIALIGEAGESAEFGVRSAESPAAISPRARNLATQIGLDPARLTGSGPGGRIIERDVLAAQVNVSSVISPAVPEVKLTPVAKAMVTQGGYLPPEQGTGPGGRVMARDLAPRAAEPTPAQAAPPAEATRTPLAGIRKTIAERMRHSLQSTAQLTMQATADARALQAYRKRLKASPAELGLQGITLNDLVLFAVARTLLRFPPFNAQLSEGVISQFADVHLGFACDTPRGLLVPVICNAQRLSLKQLAEEGKRLAAACQAGTIKPDELTGGSFTVTNLGGLGIESFTPILNAPQVAILGVGNIQLKPMQDEDSDAVSFIPHIGLSLTVDHQAVDGGPAARFLQALTQSIAQIDLLLAT